MKKTLLLSVALIFSTILFAQSDVFVGEWTTYDEKTNEPNSVVKIYKSTNGTYFGKIVKLLGVEEPEKVKCTACTGADRNRPVEGLIIVKSMRHVNRELIDGTITDPKTGKVYNCKITFEPDGRLKIRASVDKKGKLGQSQYWTRTEE